MKTKCPKCGNKLDHTKRTEHGGTMIRYVSLCAACLYRESFATPNPQFQPMVIEKERGEK